jgi:hypothetical protein
LCWVSRVKFRSFQERGTAPAGRLVLHWAVSLRRCWGVSRVKFWSVRAPVSRGARRQGRGAAPPLRTALHRSDAGPSQGRAGRSDRAGRAGLGRSGPYPRAARDGVPRPAAQVPAAAWTRPARPAAPPSPVLWRVGCGGARAAETPSPPAGRAVGAAGLPAAASPALVNGGAGG